MNLAQHTYRRERIRGLFLGLIEILWQPAASVALLIAIRVYDAPYVYKSIIPASGFAGFMLTPFTLILVARSNLNVSRVAAGLFAITGLFLCVSATWQHLGLFVLLTSLGHVILVQHVPLITQLYSSNFDMASRGKKVGTVFLISGAVSAVASLGAGWLMDLELSAYRLILLCCGIACFLSALTLWGIPSLPLDRQQVGNVWTNLSIAWKDKLFGWMLSAWMLMGLGNLICLPLRTEVMANPVYGIDASNQQILLITGTIPLIARLLTTRLFGSLFDRWNLVHLRIMLNVLFTGSILLFFNTSSLFWMGVSMAMLGCAFAGGRITWALWVTKLAAPNQTSAYMSVHLLTTGFRGCIAPFIGFALIETISLPSISLLGGGLVVVATVMFFPAARAVQQRTDENTPATRPQGPKEAGTV